MCSKNYFLTEEQALEGLCQAVEYSVTNKDRRECAYYYCHYCGFYHLTSVQQYPEWRQEDINNKLIDFMIDKYRTRVRVTR